MKKRFDDTFKIFNKSTFFSYFFIENEVLEKQIENKVFNNIELTNFEYYFYSTEFYLLQIYSLCQDLSMSLEFINDLQYKKYFRKNHFDFIAYQLENHIIRLLSVKDWILQLINIVYQLNIEEQKVCKRTVIEKNSTSLDKEIIQLYKDLEDILSKEKNIRDEVIHRQKYRNIFLARLYIMHYHDYLKNQKSSELGLHPINNNTHENLKSEIFLIVLKFNLLQREINNKTLKFFEILEKEFICKKEKLHMNDSQNNT